MPRAKPNDLRLVFVKLNYLEHVPISPISGLTDLQPVAKIMALHTRLHFRILLVTGILKGDVRSSKLAVCRRTVSRGRLPRTPGCHHSGPPM